MFDFLKNNISLFRITLIFSVLNLVFFHYPFFKFVFENIDYGSFYGFLMVASLFILVVIANMFTFFLLLFSLRKIGVILICILFILNALAIYFVNTYSIIIDESMIGNVLNTNYEESSSFFSFKLILYVIFFGILPSIYIIKSKINYPSNRKFFKNLGILLLSMLFLVGINAKNILWIDNHSKYLGGLAMPWSYAVNLSLFYAHKSQANQKEILLPNATIKNNEKAVVVLVIGESARKSNFSLYGYAKNTNPLLSKTENITHFEATSCATYTTAGVKCILQHADTGDLYEVLPNYLHRNDVEVIWRTSNSGEPPIHIEKYQTKETLMADCQVVNCDYDEVLASGLKKEILASKKDKILIILHTSTSHGPTYNKKYPADFEAFKPVCTSVELAKCSQEELVNAYDNTIVYTDYILSKVIENLKEIGNEYKSTMLFVSDHGESLGEKNLYMHGLPMSLAPKEQYEIPFIVWTSDKKELKPLKNINQNYVFHSVLKFLSVESPIYNEDLNIFK